MTHATFAPQQASRSYSMMIFRRFLNHRMAVVGAIVVLLLCFSALFASSTHRTTLCPTYVPPVPRTLVWEYPLNRRLGRDTLSRLLYGGSLVDRGIVAI